jgi:hypothetical protein
VLRPRFLVALVTAIPLALTANLWVTFLRAAAMRATNGSSYYAAAQAYSHGIFPDTFGWTSAWFGGMPFPNLYPPLFFWTVGALAHILPFPLAFKLTVAAPVIAMPALMWMLAFLLSGRDRILATWAGLGTAFLLVSPALQLDASGLGYWSTFVDGFYSQPLGFALLVLWYVVYRDADRSRLRFAAATVLLALAILASFFSAITACVFIGATLLRDAFKWRADERRAFVIHLLSPAWAALLTLFWVAPMLHEYAWFVTAHVRVPLRQMISPWLWAWYAIAAVGLAFWCRRRDRDFWPYAISVVTLALCVTFSAAFAPSWFPFQPHRFLATLTFLLCLPVAHAFQGLLSVLARSRKAQPQRSSRISRMLVPLTALALLAVAATTVGKPSYTLAFYSHAEMAEMQSVLKFAAAHPDGRYLVEQAGSPALDRATWFDARALSAYLGAQGNETTWVAFRESSASTLFAIPAINGFSSLQEHYGLSSVLGDDLDFLAQPTADHLRRAELLGVRYLVVTTPAIRERIAGQHDVVSQQQQLGRWTVFELRQPLPAAQVLAYRPALVVSDLSLKQRRRDQLEFVRLAEEEFAAGQSDVALVHAPERFIDDVLMRESVDRFGALILVSYAEHNEQRALDLLRRYARQHTVLLVQSDAPLFERLRGALADSSNVVTITREPGDDTGNVSPLDASFHYANSGIRATWKMIQRSLDEHKVAVPTATATLNRDGKRMQLVVASTESVPVMLSTTYFPAWRRSDDEPVYAASRMQMLTFAKGSVTLRYERAWQDWAGLAVSLLAALGLIAACVRRF